MCNITATQLHSITNQCECDDHIWQGGGNECVNY